MVQRDVFRNHDYWHRRVDYIAERIIFYEELSSVQTLEVLQKQQLRFQIFRRQVELTISKYYRGDDLSSVRLSFYDVVQSLDKFRAAFDHDPFDFSSREQYMFALWLLSLTITLDIEPEIGSAIVDMIGNRARDAVYEQLVTLLATTQPIATDTLLYPRPYEFLYKTLSLSGDESITMFQKFLERYYRGMRHCYWYESHLLPDHGFFGYWCFELAAFVRRRDINDQTFVMSTYYPRDLAVKRRSWGIISA